MRTIEDYFTHVGRLIQGAPDVLAKRYEEQILSVTRGNLRIRPRFSDQPLLEISEAIVLMAGERRWLTRYHYQDSSTDRVFRYDNAPHHPEVSTHPEHKHLSDEVVANLHPSIDQVLLEVRAYRDRLGKQETGVETRGESKVSGTFLGNLDGRVFRGGKSRSDWDFRCFLAIVWRAERSDQRWAGAISLAPTGRGTP